MESTDTHIFILCIIGIVQLVCSTDDFLEAMYSKNIHYPNLIPSHGGFYLVERLDLSLVQCVTLCVITGSECVGVFYNQNLKTCNSMSNPGNVELLLKTQSGSEYFSENPCEIGWYHFNNNCYYWSLKRINWENARLSCLQKAAHLVEIESEPENTWIKQNFKPTNCTTSWTSCVLYIGGNDLNMEGSFVWSSNGRPLNYTNWSSKEPNSFTTDDDCIVLISPGGRWADFACLPEKQFLCKKSL